MLWPRSLSGVLIVKDWLFHSIFTSTVVKVISKTNMLYWNRPVRLLLSCRRWESLYPLGSSMIGCDHYCVLLTHVTFFSSCMYVLFSDALCVLCDLHTTGVGELEPLHTLTALLLETSLAPASLYWWRLQLNSLFKEIKDFFLRKKSNFQMPFITF